MSHPNLSAEINNAIAQSEKDGGWWLKDLPVNTPILVQTKNSVYGITKRETEPGVYVYTIEGHPVYCPKPTQCHIAGSTWGGSMLKAEWIGVGMHLEVFLPGQGTMTTTKIKNVTVCYQ